ncbi:putative membrane protein [Criblamydia sequanensis CRIB-18]|uniref:Membrane protein n=2 Tax=Candidatus Criblamydia sequanensis TaxID=340071 RepID=A0A090CZW0_9BACT|nr:putative membrane protein [Criblamydia sequanensis CRIB-18]
MGKYKFFSPFLFSILLSFSLFSVENKDFSLLIKMDRKEVSVFTPFEVSLAISHPEGWKVNEKHWFEILRLFKEMIPDLKVRDIEKLSETKTNVIYKIQLEAESPHEIKASFGVIPFTNSEGNAIFIASPSFKVKAKESDSAFSQEIEGFYPLSQNLPLEIDKEIKRLGQGQDRITADTKLFIENKKEKRRFVFLSLLTLALLVSFLLIYAFGFFRSFSKAPLKQESPLSLKNKLLRKIHRLKTITLESNEDTRHFYSEMTQLLREAAIYKGNLLALSQTKEEFLSSMKDKADESELSFLGRLLESGDLVKFAKGALPREECLNDLNILEKWINKLFYGKN